jgi:hypothetical protein
MRPLRETCEDSNAVRSFCDCISSEEPVDVATETFCTRDARVSGNIAGDELVELKKSPNNLEETDLDEGCCDC